MNCSCEKCAISVKGAKNEIWFTVFFIPKSVMLIRNGKSVDDLVKAKKCGWE